ncbi:MAG: hypothetical protein MJ231_05215, partial [bacterium]|nr:hypothetical protein [bacterium]
LDMLSYLKPQKSTPSVDPSSLGSKLAAKSKVDNGVQEKADFSAYYSELLNSGVLDIRPASEFNMDDIVKTAMQEGHTAKDAVNVKNAHQAYSASIPSVSQFGIDVAV